MLTLEPNSEMEFGKIIINTKINKYATIKR
jgi:hypothetical protein